LKKLIYSRNVDGEYKNYHKNGKISLKGRYSKGLNEGNWFLYTEEGKLIRIDWYIHGKKIKN